MKVKLGLFLSIHNYLSAYYIYNRYEIALYFMPTF